MKSCDGRRGSRKYRLQCAQAASDLEVDLWVAYALANIYCSGAKERKTNTKANCEAFFAFFSVLLGNAFLHEVWAVIAYESGSISLLPYRLSTSVLLCATLLPVAPYGGEIGQWGSFSS